MGGRRWHCCQVASVPTARPFHRLLKLHQPLPVRVGSDNAYTRPIHDIFRFGVASARSEQSVRRYAQIS